eukprot:970114-Rhodomonas_salina.2
MSGTSLRAVAYAQLLYRQKQEAGEEEEEEEEDEGEVTWVWDVETCGQQMRVGDLGLTANLREEEDTYDEKLHGYGLRSGCGTELGYGATRSPVLSSGIGATRSGSTSQTGAGTLCLRTYRSAYADAMRCPHTAPPIKAICYTRATRCPVLTVLSTTHVLRDVRYPPTVCCYQDELERRFLKGFFFKNAEIRLREPRYSRGLEITWDLETLSVSTTMAGVCSYAFAGTDMAYNPM